MKKYSLEIYCDYLNDIIEQAIIHGGDVGGAYFVNKEELIKSIKTFIDWTGLNKYLIIYKSDFPKLLIKNNLENKGDDENEK